MRGAETIIVLAFRSVDFSSRELLTTSRIAEALLEAERIKYLQMAFASKLLTFMEPQMAAV